MFWFYPSCCMSSGTHCGFDLISLMTNDSRHLSWAHWLFVPFPWRSAYFYPLPISIVLLTFFLMSVLFFLTLDLWQGLKWCQIVCVFFFNFNFYFILLYNTVLVLPYIDMNPPRLYMSSQSWSPHPTSLPISSLWIIPMHQPQASCILYRT